MAILQAPASQAPAASSSTDRAWELYYQIRPQIETPENIGKLILFDLVSGDYEIAEDNLGIEATGFIRERHPDAKVFCLRIGYDASAAISGSMERLPE